MAKKKKFVDTKAAGTRASYAKVLKRIEKDGVCPFCPENFKYHTRPILRKGKFWLVTENMNPYAGAKHHYLLVHITHIETPDKISSPAWRDLQNHLSWLIKSKKLPAGGFFMRFGDTQYTGGSVAHLHAQLITGVKRSKDTFPIAAIIGFGKRK